MAAPTFSSLFAPLMFGTVGFGAFVYGKKIASWRPMVIGAALMAYPYFISSVLLMYVIGIALCASLYLFRD